MQRQTASQNQPAFTEKENVTDFMSTLSAMYYNRMIGHAITSFKNLVQAGECLKDRFKTGKIKDYQTLFEQSSNRVGESTKKTFLNKKKEKCDKEVHIISSHTSRLNIHMLILLPFTSYSTFLCSSCSHYTCYLHHPYKHHPYTSNLPQSYHVSATKDIPFSGSILEGPTD